MATRADYAHDVLLALTGESGTQYLGARWALMGWTVAESGSNPCNGKAGMGAAYNPFNTTLVLPGSTAYNAAKVQNYTSYQQGVQAAVDTLKEAPYAGVVAALSHTGDLNQALRVIWEITNSPWGTSIADGFNGFHAFLDDKPLYNNLTVGA